LIEPINITAISWNEFKKSNPPGEYFVTSEGGSNKALYLLNISKNISISDGIDVIQVWGFYVSHTSISYFIGEESITKEEFIGLLQKDYPQYLQYFLFQEEFLNG
jgi:hypothetical protein